MSNTPQGILQTYWKHDTFRPQQLEIIQHVLEGQDTFALLPTGGGKSICFQIPVLIRPGICIVISPLKALMHDQVNQLTQKGIKAIALPSGISYERLDNLLDNCIYGNYKFLYLSPERLQQEIVQERIKKMHVSLIAVDEAHCISQWGHDFRPAYQKINLLREIHPKIPILALTASATPKVIADAIDSLMLVTPKIYKASFYRANLCFHIVEANDKNEKILELLQIHTGSAIVYVRNRKSTALISGLLNQFGIPSTFYHGGISEEEKKARFRLWQTEQIRVMVATNAFGMGIDKANVRLVVHYHIPENIESYFQEVGRAGRDGKLANTFLLKNNADFDNMHRQFIAVLPSSKVVKLVYRKLCNYFRIAYGEVQHTSFDFNFATFCSTYKLKSMLTYNALIFLDRCEVIRFSKRFVKRSAIRFLVSGKILLQFIEKNKNFAKPVQAVLRIYSGVFEQFTPIELSKITKRITWHENELIRCFRALEKLDLLQFRHAESDSEITFLVPREDDRTINRIKHHLVAQNRSRVKKVQSMIEFVAEERKCLNQRLLSYFGESKTQNCGKCSVCKKYLYRPSKQDNKKIEAEIIAILKQKNQSSKELISQLNFPENQILEVLIRLNRFGSVQIQSDNTYAIKGKCF